MSVRPYNPSVRVGNWNEDLWLEEELLKDFVDKRDKNQLVLLKGPLFNNIFQPTKLSQPQNGKVCFGHTICIHNPDTEENLSLCITNKTYDDETVKPQCNLTSSKMLQSTHRNSFVIKSCDGTSHEGEFLCYGQEFFLRTLPGVSGDLNVCSERATLFKSAKKSCHNEVYLTDSVSYGSKWRVVHFDPQQRLETEGTHVPANTKVVIMHSKTNEALACLARFAHSTPLGKEHEVVTHTYLDSHKAEGGKNHWIFVTDE